ncbi:MAG: transporter substrate-binding domain-containing protein [Synergistaceae bacterium]|jgi:L-cystine transport system substrate-binding protein|nr:transporter substrate-binding domain-containing protein [Synergistaceae bacterium]
MKNSDKYVLFLLGITCLLMTPWEVCAVEKVTVGTEGAYAPFNYVDKDGNADGFNVAVMKAADELLPDVKFVFEPTEWTAIFVALESGRYDIIATNLNKNAEREVKYLFSELPYMYSTNVIAFKSGRTDIRSTQDLHGKTVTASLGSTYTAWLEKYNAENGNLITISYSDGDFSKMLLELVTGRADALLGSAVAINLLAKEQNIPIDSVPWKEKEREPTFVLFAKNTNGERLKKLVDPALETLLKNGTLAELSKKYLGADYSSEKTDKVRIHGENF